MTSTDRDERADGHLHQTADFTADLSAHTGRAYCFGEFALLPALFELRRHGRLVPVQPKVFDLMVFLVENRHRVVTHADLRDALWAGVTVTEASLTYSVKAARRALCDDGRVQAIIRNVRGRGYRFLAEVEIRVGAIGPAYPQR